MKCPFCGKGESQVLESRIVEDGNALRRRRECIACKKRFTTYEKVKENFLWVIKKDGRREPFDREKVKRGILKAIEKRPVSLELIDDIVESIEREMLTYEKEEITSRMIGKAVLRSLKKIDKVAWLRFASVYLEFEDLKDFEKAIEKGL
ncbi:MAG TPA: transcriptional regulator NrdR [Patescibacteria group bacterium]|nr:transcriptional regulator NrdR [Patescibacteria group bacterium]